MQTPDLGEDPLALDRQVCFALSVASRNVISLYRPLLAPMNLTHPQYLVMLALWERSPRSVTDLCAALHADAATLSPLLKRLEAVGYVVRTRSRSDERRLEVALTDEGARLRAEAEKIPYRIVETLGVELSALEELHGLLSTIIAASRRALDARNGGQA
ncbi:MarR family winged helix-turn-helix transcriptional regulator [Saccharopolyspora flava]|uniref:DNA-binding transcriptional regulator, MarR family n=1 Tax=Saccharopolyspora flava TaxID=95161 RepID=A0A1I6SL08_9PSEU|nr:MarR family transcriptional regulator [Saccharopolyspora flava]SFS77636.1 DNA-binding transcriptional regulator, MarR family [Saccharopolyspora flava]